MSPSQNIWHFPEEFIWIQTDHQHDMRNMIYKKVIFVLHTEILLRECEWLAGCCSHVDIKKQCGRVTYCLRLFSNENVLHKQEQGDGISAEDLHGIQNHDHAPLNNSCSLMWRLLNTWPCNNYRYMSTAFPYRGDSNELRVPKNLEERWNYFFFFILFVRKKVTVLMKGGLLCPFSQHVI